MLRNVDKNKSVFSHHLLFSEARMAQCDSSYCLFACANMLGHVRRLKHMFFVLLSCCVQAEEIIKLQLKLVC